MSNSTPHVSTVPNFTSEQIDYLERMFPEQYNVPDDANELYMRLGRRQVVNHIKLIMAHKRKAVPK